MATKKETRHEVTRVALTIHKPFDTVLKRLESSIVQKTAMAGVELFKHNSSLEDWEAEAKVHAGPHDFMQFMDFDHAAWIHLYGVHAGKQARRIILGNPLIAITMMKHDVDAGLFVPVEAYVVERGIGETDVIYIKPSTLIAGYPGADEKLKEAAEALDAKFARLWDWVAEEE